MIRNVHVLVGRLCRLKHGRILASCIFAATVLTSFAACQESVAPTSETPSEVVGSCLLELSDDATDEDAIQAVLRAEGETVVSQDIDQLMSLWSEDARVSDAKYTPDDDSDNQYWQGKDAIRHRYVRTVFPGAPATVQPSDLAIVIVDEQASVIATTHIGDEVSPAGDRWELVRKNGCWLIESLTYNLEPTE